MSTQYSGPKLIGTCGGSPRKSCGCRWKKYKKKSTQHGWKQAEPNKRLPTVGAKKNIKISRKYQYLYCF